jgi:hypothetical protein
MNIAPTAHHPDGPSQWPAIAECPCFESEKDIEEADIESLDEAAGEKHGSDAKGRGQAQHGGLAKALTGQPDAFAGLSVKEEQDVRWTAEAIVEYAASMGYGADEIRVEQRVTMFSPSGFDELYFGTLDVRFGPFICDAKFGDERNYVPQLAGYDLPIMEQEGYARITNALFYGRLRRKRFFPMDRKTVETIAYRILAKRHSPDRQPKVCSYCGWCQRATYCEALNAKVDVVLAKREDEWGMRLPTMSATAAGADPVLLGAMKWLWKAYLEPWAKSVDYACTVCADQGNTPLGFTKQNEKGRLDIHDPAKAFAALTAAGVPREAIEAAAGFTMKDLAEAYQQATGCPKTVAPAKVEALLVAAGAAARGPATFKLIRQPGAEDEIRAALARPVNVLSLPNAEQRTNLTEQQGTTNTP